MQGKTILLVDDEPHITHLMGYKFEQLGANVQIAEDGGQALAIAQEQLPDLIITDFQMPVLSGFDLCIALFQQQATASIPVIMLTARGHKLDPDQMALTHIKHVMAKPFSARELIGLTKELLASQSNPDSPEMENREEAA